MQDDQQNANFNPNQSPSADESEQIEQTPQEQQLSADQMARNESGLPGGGVGRMETPGHTGVYPVSADEGASPDANVESEEAFGQGSRGAAGYQDSGDSEIIP